MLSYRQVRTCNSGGLPELPQTPTPTPETQNCQPLTRIPEPHEAIHANRFTSQLSDYAEKHAKSVCWIMLRNTPKVDYAEKHAKIIGLC